jgi:hypothetical protein
MNGPDFRLTDGAGLIGFELLTDAAQGWFLSYLQARSTGWRGRRLWVHPNHASEILKAATEAGLIYEENRGYPPKDGTAPLDS